MLSLNKPAGMSSYDVIRALKRAVSNLPRRVGHAGTLDPFATGVLLVLLGDATKLSGMLMAGPKEYRAQIRLGLRTDTDDITGKVLEEKPVPQLEKDAIAGILARFTGVIEQTPPAYSALKQNGERLYHKARRGEQVVVRPRRVTVSSLELVDWHRPVLTVRTEVSGGTYVRALGRDIGQALGTGAVVCSLVRTRCGWFRVEDSIDVEGLSAASVAAALVGPEDALPGMARLTVSPVEALSLARGRTIATVEPGAGCCLVMTADRSFVALAEVSAGVVRTRRVLCHHA